MEIPEFYSNLLSSPGPATLSVITSGGHIQSSLVWPDFDGECIKINLLIGSPKEKNIRREGKASLLVMHRSNENFYIALRCELEKITQEGAIEHLDSITQRNANVGQWYGAMEPRDSPTRERRAIAYLRPVHVYCS